MDLACKIMTLQSIRGVGVKAIAGLPTKELLDVSEVDTFYELLKVNFEKNKRIVLPTIAELGQVVEYNSSLLYKSLEQGIKAYTFMDEAFPKRLAELSQPCQLLFVKGDAAVLKQKSVAIIGTREISPLGEKVGKHFAKQVVNKGWAVVSGLAIGCDTSGHVGCLEAGGKTVAILAGGLDNIYPKQNTRLAEEIVESGGCLISEYPIGVQANAYRLVARDRLQSGLASGVMVVETGVKSGTMHAVNHALNANKPLGCCDFDRFSPGHCDQHIHALGNRMLIEQGKAQGLCDQRTIDAFLFKCEEYLYAHSNGVSSAVSAPEVTVKYEEVPASGEQLSLF